MSENDSQSAPSRFEINVGTEDSASASFGSDGKVTTDEVKNNVGVSFNQDGTTTRTDLRDGEAVEAEVEADLKENGEEGTEAEAKDEPEGDPQAFNLPDYDPENEEVAAKYAEKYVGEDGGLKFEAFNASFYENLQAGTADINPNERAFVKKHTGMSDAAIDTYLKGVASEVKAKDDAFYSAAGGKEAYEGMMGWATSEAGYTAEQKARWNAALKAGGPELQEQVELLKVRYGAANPKTTEEPKPVVKERRKSSPETSATNGVATNSVPKAEPFASLADYQKANAAAHASGKVSEMKAVEERLRASPTLWKR